MHNGQSEMRNGWFRKVADLLGGGGQPDDPQSAIIALIAQYRGTDISDDTAVMVENVLKLDQAQVRDIMIPRGQITLIQDNWDFDKVLSIILDSGHSRYPVVDEEHEKVKGILITKDLFPILSSRITDQDYLSVIRPATIVPESKALDTMLRDFKTNRNHMALVIDEYGSLSGLVTIEDVIEEIVGEIDDEHDEIPDADYRELDKDHYLVKALMSIEDFNERFGADYSDEDADTIGGFVLQQFGRMPANGESIHIGRWQFTVSKASQRRLNTLKIQPAPYTEEY